MNVPNERDDELLRAMLTSSAEGPAPSDQEVNDAFAAYQRVEALFDLLRRPADAVAGRIMELMGETTQQAVEAAA